MSRDDSLAIAELSGWVEAPSYKGQLREGMPVLQKGDSLLWHHAQGVTVADIIPEQRIITRFRNYRRYSDLDEALKKEP